MKIHFFKKPCPFCGGKAELTRQDWYEYGYAAYLAVICKKCGAKTKNIEFHIYHNCGGRGSEHRAPHEKQAVDLWNMSDGKC